MTNEQLESKVTELDKWHNESEKRFEAFMAKMDMYIEKTDQSLAEQRERMNRIEDKTDNISRHVQGLTIAAMVGIGAMSISIVAFVAVAIYKS